MSRHILKIAAVVGLAGILAAGGVFAGSALADGYDLQYGDAADIARASRWALDEEYEEGGYAGANYYDNEADYEDDDRGGYAGSNYYDNERRTTYVYVDSSSSYTPDDYSGDCWWSGTTARWDSQRDSGEKYQIQLRRGGSEVTTVKTSSNSYNFSSNITMSGYYKFRVRIVRGSRHGDWGDYSEERYFEGRSSSSSSSSGGPGPSNVVNGWNRDNRGWWYRNADGSYDILVYWGSSASEFSEWKIHGTYDEYSGALFYRDGRYAVVATDDSGKESISEQAVTQGVFLKEGDRFRWIDSMNENSIEIFERVAAQ